MSRVIIDGGSVVNILPAKTLDYLGVDPSQLRSVHFSFRASIKMSNALLALSGYRQSLAI